MKFSPDVTRSNSLLLCRLRYGFSEELLLRFGSTKDSRGLYATEFRYRKIAPEKKIYAIRNKPVTILQSRTHRLCRIFSNGIAIRRACAARAEWLRRPRSPSGSWCTDTRGRWSRMIQLYTGGESACGVFSFSPHTSTRRNRRIMRVGFGIAPNPPGLQCSYSFRCAPPCNIRLWFRAFFFFFITTNACSRTRRSNSISFGRPHQSYFSRAKDHFRRTNTNVWNLLQFFFSIHSSNTIPKGF